MKIVELIETIRGKEKKHPHILVLEGMIGSGKSYEAEKVFELLECESLLISTDLFVTVPRSEWAKRLDDEDLDLRNWYDLPKIKKTLESIKIGEFFPPVFDSGKFLVGIVTTENLIDSSPRLFIGAF